jgi:hypothetical protein
MDVSPMSEGEEERAKLARNRLERYCRETKRQLGENEVGRRVPVAFRGYRPSSWALVDTC